MVPATNKVKTRNEFKRNCIHPIWEYFTSNALNEASQSVNGREKFRSLLSPIHWFWRSGASLLRYISEYASIHITLSLRSPSLRLHDAVLHCLTTCQSSSTDLFSIFEKCSCADQSLRKASPLNWCRGTGWRHPRRKQEKWETSRSIYRFCVRVARFSWGSEKLVCTVLGTLSQLPDHCFVQPCSFSWLITFVRGLQ